MESSNYRKTDPSVLLQNEIEILLTQIHLMELYVKQAQATAANDAARRREEQQAESLALKADLEQREQQLKQYQTATSAVDHTLNRQLQALQTRLQDTEKLLHNREHKLQEANAEIRSLREHMALVESEIRNRAAATHEAERVRQGLQSDLASLRRDLEEKNAEILRFQATTREREEDWQGQLLELQVLLTEKQGWLQGKEAELERAKGEIARLARRISDLELAAGEARLAAAHELELTRTKFQTDLDALLTELRSKEETLQDREREGAALEGHLQRQSDDLRRELRENKELLEERQRQLQDFQSQTATLHERIAILDSEKQQIGAAAAAELETVRREAAAEIVQRRTELEEKERQLAGQQAAALAEEQSNQDRFRALQQQLNEKKTCLETRENELDNSKVEIAALLERIAAIEASQTEAHALASRELAQAHESFDAERANLHAKIEEKEQALLAREARHTESERLHQIQVQDLRKLLDEKRRELEGHEQELHDSRSQLHAQEELNRALRSANERSQLALSEAESLRQGLQSELSNLRNDLFEKEKSLAERETSVTATEHSLQAQIQELQGQLLEGQASLEVKSRELAHAQSEVSALKTQIAHLEIEVREAESSPNSQAEQVREQLQSEVAELGAALKASNALLLEREAAFASTESNLNSAIDRLRTEFAEKQGLLDHSHTELERARSEIAALRQQNLELELRHNQTEKLLSVQGEQIRARIRTEIDMLETQLRERDAVLLTVRNQFNESQSNLESKIDELQCELADRRLLNVSRAAEIEDLKSQVNHLLEKNAQEKLSLQQTEDALKNENVRIRQSYEAEIAILREELQSNRTEHDKRTAAFKFSEDQQLHELSDLQAQLTEKENLINALEHDLEKTKGELVAVSEKLIFFEANQRREKEASLSEANRTEASLRTDLAAKDRALEERDDTIERLRNQYREETDGRQREVTELRGLLDTRNTELEEAKAAVAPLRLRVAELEEAVGYIEQTKCEAQAAVAALQAELSQRTETLQHEELTAKQQLQVLQSKMTALQTAAREKHSLLESRNEELVRVKTDLDKLQARLSEAEYSAKRAQEAAATENETMRTELQAQIAYLQAELSQRDWALAEREAARGIQRDPQLRNDDSSTHRLATAGRSEKGDEEFVLGEPRVIGTRDQRLRDHELVETVTTEDGQRFAAVRQRRWQTGWKWKRRWKT